MKQKVKMGRACGEYVGVSVQGEGWGQLCVCTLQMHARRTVARIRREPEGCEVMGAIESPGHTRNQNITTIAQGFDRGAQSANHRILELPQCIKCRGQDR